MDCKVIAPSKKGLHVKFTSLTLLRGRFGLYILEAPVAQRFAECTEISTLTLLKYISPTPYLGNSAMSSLGTVSIEAGLYSASHVEESLQKHLKLAESASFDAVSSHKGLMNESKFSPILALSRPLFKIAGNRLHF